MLYFIYVLMMIATFIECGENGRCKDLRVKGGPITFEKKAAKCWKLLKNKKSDITNYGTFFNEKSLNKYCSSKDKVVECLSGVTFSDNFGSKEGFLNFFKKSAACQETLKQNLTCINDAHKKAVKKCRPYCFEAYFSTEDTSNPNVTEEKIKLARGICKYRTCFARCVLANKIDCKEIPHEAKQRLYEKFLREDTINFISLQHVRMVAVTNGIGLNGQSCELHQFGAPFLGGDAID